MLVEWIQQRVHSFSNYQLLAHLIFRFAISVSSSSLANARMPTMNNMGEHAKMTLATVQTVSRAVSIVEILCGVVGLIRSFTNAV